MRWQVQEAKQRFSEVVRAAETGEPQVVTRHGMEIVVMIDIASYRRFHGGSVSLMGYLRCAPHVDLELPVERQRDLPREVELVD
ncbi:MAG: type II toxin-antitoxin system Phd/YefM family antitoxin [Dactylosporangium sp.]|nr:type II toxin-antitoxin system Phd/YefM family antitoxin [Dactylosporangium sp.]NNJ59735.1 type II toxin-antitoxin system Phd/YefM family antitoxin [Dactylosporangium sp.]